MLAFFASLRVDHFHETGSLADLGVHLQGGLVSPIFTSSSLLQVSERALVKKVVPTLANRPRVR